MSRAIHSSEPRMMPAWGPPSSLSPEKLMMSTPARTLSITVGSPWMPMRSRSKKQPLPRSSITGRPCLRPRATRSCRGTLSEKPRMR